MAGGSCDLVSLDATGVQPTAKLAITGSGARCVTMVETHPSFDALCRTEF